MPDCSGEGIEEGWRKQGKRLKAYFKQHRKSVTVAKTSVIILRTVQNSFVKAASISRNLKAELDHGI